MATSAPQPIDEQKLHDFAMRGIVEMGASLNAALIIVGDKLGLYKAMAGAGPIDSAELAARTGTHERYVREWLAAQAAGAFVEYDAATNRFTLPPENAMVLADENSPVFLPGAFYAVAACIKDEGKITDAFRTGKGVGWHEHDESLYPATERFFRPNYRAHLTADWIPALSGVEAKLNVGARVADIGCGLGTSTILMAQAYPKATFAGFDYHPESIRLARDAAARAGVSDRVTFEIARAKEFPGRDFDFITFFDCLHDMGDPEGAASHVRKALAPDGTWMIVEPFANDKLQDNLNPIGRAFYAASTMLCTPVSLSQEVGLALGAQAGEQRLEGVLRSAGFTRVRRAAETPFNLILEARP